jgi:hypothetical protein
VSAKTSKRAKPQKDRRERKENVDILPHRPKVIKRKQRSKEQQYKGRARRNNRVG